MNFPPDPPSSTASGSDNNSTLRPTRPQQSVWGQASSQAGIRRGLTPLATSDLTSAPGAATRRPAPSSSPGPFNNTTSPLASTFSSVLSSSNRLASNRQPSSSSSNSPFTIFQAGAQQPSSLQSGASVSSPRSRTITPLSHLVSTAASASATQGGGAAGGGGGLGTAGSRIATYSPSLPGTNITSPTTFNFERSAILPSGATAATTGQSSLSKISVAQVSLLLDTISEKEGKVKWEQKADQIRKVCLHCPSLH
jgi:CCR4-NOT transcription complex subunit 1